MRKKLMTGLSVFVLLMVFYIGSPMFLQSVQASGNPKMNVESVEATAGEEISINVSIENNPGIYGAEVYVHYDEEALTLINAKDQGVFDNYTYDKALKSEYMLMWDADSENMMGEGVVTVLTFKVNDAVSEGSYNVWIEYEEDCIFNDAWENVAVEIIKGGVKVLPSKGVSTDLDKTVQSDGSSKIDNEQDEEVGTFATEATKEPETGATLTGHTFDQGAISKIVILVIVIVIAALIVGVFIKRTSKKKSE